MIEYQTEKNKGKRCALIWLYVPYVIYEYEAESETHQEEEW